MQYRSLANVKRVISEAVTKGTKRYIREHSNHKKSAKTDTLDMNQTVRKEQKRDAAVFWQFACGHALTGDYLKNMIKKDEQDECWYCETGAQQTRTHLFPKCRAFREEQREMGKAVKEAVRKRQEKRGGGRVNGMPLKKLFAMECTTKAVLVFLKKTRIGRTGRPPDPECTRETEGP